MGEIRNVYTVFVGNLYGKSPLGKPRRWENNIKINLMKIDCEDGIGFKKLRSRPITDLSSLLPAMKLSFNPLKPKLI
jgi:hypothetical protein